MPDFKASLGVGFEALASDSNYHGMSDEQKQTFKQDFGTELLGDLQNWFDEQFQSNAMDDWDDFLLPISNSEGTLSETSVATRINARLNPGGSPTPRFKVDYPAYADDLRGVRYFYYNGVRVCLHSHSLLKWDESTSTYEPWDVPDAALEDEQQRVTITLAWSSPPEGA